jgi:hypothetical protein
MYTLTDQSLLDSGKYSDFVITCGFETFNVHKAVVCARSGFFERAERFAVGRQAYQEPRAKTEEGKVHLPEDEPEIIKLLIQYLYEGEYDPKLPDGKAMDDWDATSPSNTPITGRVSEYHYKFPHTCIGNCPNEYNVCHHHECRETTCGEKCVNFTCRECCPTAFAPDPLPPAEGDASQLLRHAKMYEIGDKYDVKGLKELAREKFLRGSSKYWDDDVFSSVAYYVFSTTAEEDHGLRGIVIKIISRHMALLSKPAVEALVDEFHGLAAGIVKTCAKQQGSREGT